MDEVLIALSVSAASDPNAQALEQLPNLKGCQAHTSVIVGDVDRKLFVKLFYQVTFEAKYENNSVIFSKKVYIALKANFHFLKKETKRLIANDSLFFDLLLYPINPTTIHSLFHNKALCFLFTNLRNDSYYL